MKKDKELKYYYLEDKIFKNHNNSIMREIIGANIDNLEKTAIFYRGKKISYCEIIYAANDYAKALKVMGFKKGDEIPVCMSNTPEAVILFLAISFIGAKVNAFSDSFDKHYIKQILEGTKSSTVFVTNDLYQNIGTIIDNEKDIKNVVVFSLSDSYPNGVNPYLELENLFLKSPTYCVAYYKSTYPNKNILNKSEFCSLSKKFVGVLEDDGNLEDVFYIGYEMDAENSMHPHALEYKNKNFLASGIIKREKSSINESVLAQIPNCYSVGMISLIFDTLVSSGTVCLEYINSKTFFPASLIINKSNVVYASKEYWISLFKELENNHIFENVNSLPYLTTPVSIFDSLSKNEEKYLNVFLKKYSAGKDRLTCSSKMSQIFVNSLYGEAFFKDSRSNDAFHVSNIVDSTILNEEKKYLTKENYGFVVLNSRCLMANYRDEKLNNLASLSAFDGQQWISTNYLGCLNKNSSFSIKGKLNHPQARLAMAIKEVILKDEKNVLSCEVVPIDTMEKDTYFVAHMTLMPGWKNSIKDAINNIENRLKRFVPTTFISKIVYRIRNNDFELQPSGKIDEASLFKDRFDKTVKVYSMKDNLYLASGIEHVESEVLAKRKAYNIKPIR